MEIQETRSKILTAAAGLISKEGYHNVSVREICEASGVTKPVLYYYFKDKEDVLAELIREGYNHFKELIRKFINTSSPFEENLDGLYNVYVDYAYANPSLIRTSIFVQLSPIPEKIRIISSEIEKELKVLFHSIFSKGINEGYFEKEVDPEMLTLSLLAPLGIFIAKGVLLEKDKKLLKYNLIKYFEFWKSHFLKKGK